MRYLYGESDEKFVRVQNKTEKTKPLSSFKFSINPVIEGKTNEKEFNKTDVPIVFKCTPDTLLNLCVKVIDVMPLPTVYTWTIEDVCKWLRECGYRQYQNTFRVNLINGRTLLLLDASALALMNIKDFQHIKQITQAIRGLFYFEMTKFGRSLSLYPEFHNELYKLFRVRTGAKYELQRSVLWRKMQIIRQKEPNYTHWEILERWLNFVTEKPKELIANTRKYNLYGCKTNSSKVSVTVKHLETCACMPPCQCCSSELNNRSPWRLKCLPPSTSALDAKEVCYKCVPPCTCYWSSKMYQTHGVLSCLQHTFPHKYGGAHGRQHDPQYDQMAYRVSNQSEI